MRTRFCQNYFLGEMIWQNLGWISRTRGGNSASSDPKSASRRINSAPAACSFRAEHHTKIFFSLYLPAEASAQVEKKKSGARKLKNAKKTFLRGGERYRAAMERRISRQNVQNKI